MDQLRTDIRTQMDTINFRKQEGIRLKAEAEKLRGQADTACYKGATKREYGFNGNQLLQEGKAHRYLPTE